MIPRRSYVRVSELLSYFPAVCILGPRQVGKTTLARSLTDTFDKKVLYLDLENPLDLLKLSDPLDFLSSHTDALIVLDEVHRMPAL
ncbi:MAG: AAA family ATPase, partial [Bacteroidota bacterium]